MLKNLLKGLLVLTILLGAQWAPFGGLLGATEAQAATATVTLDNLRHTYNGEAKPAIAITNPAGLNAVFTYDGGPTPPTGIGSYAVVGAIQDPSFIGQASGTLVIQAAISPVQVPRTGQTSCWNRVITGDGVLYKLIETVPCAGTGQDAAERASGEPWPMPRFTDNGDGTQTDKLTGLVWLKDVNCLAAQTYPDALAKANTLAAGSCSLTDASVAGDWRMPNRTEMLSLANYQFSNGATWLRSQGFIINNTAYWTSSQCPTGSSNECASGNVWYVDVNGTASPTGPGGTSYLFPVRGGKTGGASYTVSFNSNGGSATASQSVVSNNRATEPASPTKTGATFAGWYSDAGLTSAFSFATPITGNTTLYAKWTINSYSVTASAPGGFGSITPASSTVSYNGSATLAITPNLCYSLATLTDNGGNVLGSVSNGTYTINNITANHAVAATFAGETTAPVLTVSTLPDGSYTNNSVLNISGLATDNCGVKDLTINGVSVPINPDGTFSHAQLLQTGPNLITVVATDIVGNPSTDRRTITLDQTAPELVIITPADNSKTANPLATVSGTVNETSTVTVKLGSNSQIAAMNGQNFTTDLQLVPGINTIEVTATDLAGNTSTQKRTVIYDDQKPSLAIIMPAQDIRTNQAMLTLVGTASDPYTAVTVSITMDGQTFTPAVVDGRFEQVLTFTSEKSYAIVVTATNEVGTSSTTQRNVIYDTTPPAFGIDPVTSPTTQPTQMISGTREAGATVGVTCATAIVGTVEYPTDSTWRVALSALTLGDNKITATGTDEAGNRATASANIQVITSSAYLKNLIEQLLNSGALPAKTAETLLDSLAKAESGYSSNTNLGDNMMNSFINQVDAAENSAKISVDTKDLLVNLATGVINSHGN
jgi:uncharacterized repeat protein (TIGR02543 family)